MQIVKCFGFESAVEEVQQHIVWLRRLRQLFVLILNRNVDAD